MTRSLAAASVPILITSPLVRIRCEVLRSACVCPRTFLKKPTSKLYYQIFGACCLLRWLGSPLAVCDMLFTSGFANDVIFVQNSQTYATRKGACSKLFTRWQHEFIMAMTAQRDRWSLIYLRLPCWARANRSLLAYFRKTDMMVSYSGQSNLT